MQIVQTLIIQLKAILKLRQHLWAFIRAASSILFTEQNSLLINSNLEMSNGKKEPVNQQVEMIS